MEYNFNSGRITLGEKKIKESISISGFTDSQLMEMLADGEKKALAELMKRYRTKALNYAYRFLGDFDEAEDAAQECFVKVYYNRQRFDTQMPFAPWFYKILSNSCRDRIRKRSIFTDFLERFKIQQKIDSETAEQNNFANPDIFNKALMKLPPSKREIITLRFTEDLSYEEIAGVLGISIGTVMSRLFRAKKELEKILLMMGISL